MANMYPTPVLQFKNPSEELLYHKLKNQLGPDFTVFYGRRWKAPPKRGVGDAECDFIVIQEDGAILVIEVKGGIWELREGQWYAYGEAAEDPQIQAIKNKKSLLALLRQKESLAKIYFPIDHAVALPDTTYERRAGLIGLPNLMTSGDLDSLQEWMRFAMSDCVERSHGVRCKREWIDEITQILMPNRIVKLRDILAADENKLVVLTNQQLSLVRNLARKKRLTVQGCAGSGKTWMALQQANRLSKESSIRTILLLCYNHELAKWLREQTKDIRNKCEVYTFNELCRELAINAGLITRTNNFKHRDDLPYLLLEAAERRPTYYDAIIVDEGQIFQDEWWDALECLLFNRDESHFYIFYDEHQRVYDEKHQQVPGERDPVELTVNLRNTARIHRQVTKFLPEDRLPDCNGVEGQPVELGFYDNESQLQTLLQETIHRLIQEGRISHRDIVILTSNSVETSALSTSRKLGPYRLSTSEPDNTNTIRYLNVLSYRGMERKVVIFCLEDDQQDLKHLLYVGGSRAKTKLVLFVNTSCEAQFSKRLSDGCALLTDMHPSVNTGKSLMA